MRKMDQIARKFLITTSLLGVLLASACNLPAGQPTPESTDALVEVGKPSPEAVEPTPESAGQEGVSLEINVGGVAQGFHSEVVPAVSAGTDGPWWEDVPEHIVVTLEGYPVSEHLMQPQIFIYPVQELRASEISGNTVSSLEGLLQNKQVEGTLPYLPFYNAAQVIHAQVKFVDFQNGTGVRYLTQFDQAYLPINNGELLYTFQGLTGDGAYYISAVMPVTVFGLPADATVDESLPAEFFDNFELYLADTVTLLNDRGDSQFTPDLSLLDAMIQSIAME